MRAMVQERYGRPSRVLTIRDVPLPPLAEDRVLVRVHAASLNAMDWHLIAGRPILARATTGLTRPKSARVGSDFAGVVEAVGAAVTDFAPGDTVFGSTDGALGEVVTPRARAIARMPASLRFAEAAALPVAGVTALQAVRKHGRLASGERVLILGAGGGVGTYTAQIAVADGGRVTAVTGASTVDMVRGLGVERVVSRDVEDVFGADDRYDLVIDVGGFASNGRVARLLTPTGRGVLVGAGDATSAALVASMLGARMRSLFGGRPLINFIASMDRASLEALARLVEDGQLRPIIGQTIELADAPAALDALQDGRARGKTVVRVVPD